MIGSTTLFMIYRFEEGLNLSMELRSHVKRIASLSVDCSLAVDCSRRRYFGSAAKPFHLFSPCRAPQKVCVCETTTVTPHYAPSTPHLAGLSDLWRNSVENCPEHSLNCLFGCTRAKYMRNLSLCAVNSDR